MLTFLEPAKVPGFPVVISKHSKTKPFKLGSAMMVSTETWHGKPEAMGPLLAALRYVPQVPIEEGRGGWHRGAWANDMMLEVLGQGLMEVNTHLVLEVVPATVQVHDAMAPGQRGWEREASHVRL